MLLTGTPWLVCPSRCVGGVSYKESKLWQLSFGFSTHRAFKAQHKPLHLAFSASKQSDLSLHYCIVLAFCSCLSMTNDALADLAGLEHCDRAQVCSALQRPQST